ncbi:MAG: cellulose biosynthesis cyclic di-GMP-binding regulatory protein BcsB [Verrucomicrobiae bacterium]|nr:cellulose biosynthesis cyclic di-GMP-binding regulatory protein BcsB [Verrucomicrobiae bacterium]
MTSKHFVVPTRLGTGAPGLLGRRIWVRGFVLSLVLVSGGLSPAVGEEHRLADLVDQSLQHRRTLAELFNSPEAIALEGSKSELEIELPLSSRIELLGGEIQVHYLHTVGLTSERSHLQAYWDDQELASRPLGGLRRDGRLTGQVPADHSFVNRHQLKIAVQQRSKVEDTLPDTEEAAALWTQIDPTDSWIALRYQLRPLTPKLNELRGLIDDRLWGDYTLTFVTAPVYAIGSQHLAWGGRVAQRAALWMGDRPLVVRHDDRLSDVGDEIVIGTRDELIGVLPQAITDHISASFVGAYPHPEDPRHFLLVLSGTEPEGVDRSVRAFVFHADRLPPLPRIDVTGWDMPTTDPEPAGRIETRRMQMPDLARWRNEGFPGATGSPGLAGCDLWVTHRDSETMASAWMIAGKLAQVAGDVVTTLNVIDHQPEAKRHWIAFGDRDALPGEFAGTSPLPSVFVGGELMGRRGVITQFESPMKSGRAAGFITADDRLLLQDRVTELIRPEIWDTLHGDTVVWEPGSQAPRYQRLAASFEIGEPGWLLLTWRKFTGIPWISLLFGLCGAAIITWLLRRPIHDPDPAAMGVSRNNGNRRVSRSRRLREAARRAARLGHGFHHPG